MTPVRSVVLFGLTVCLLATAALADETFYWPYSNTPPGPPPNYNLVDSVYFQGVPDLPDPLTNNVGGYYIWNDTINQTWHIANFNFTRGDSRSQFHGSILVIMDQDPAPNVNFWAQGFELTPDLLQNDRWGWVKWPSSIAENLYEIWWDFSLDYSKPNNVGDYRDTMTVVVAGCAVDFNLWSSGVAAGTNFSGENIYLGDDKTPLSTVPGFVDTYAGVTDQYQLNSAVSDPNLSRFTSVTLPGATYNVNGLVVPGTTYGDRYAGSWAYEANGVQFSTLFCPPNNAPNFLPPDGGTTVDLTICQGETIYDTVTATDPNPGDLLTMSLVSGPGTLVSTPSTSPVVGYYSFSPAYDGIYVVTFEVEDPYGETGQLTMTYNVTINTPPTVLLPNDTSVALCGTQEICLPLEVSDNDCDVTSITTNLGSYGGTLSNFDQVNKINVLGGAVIQIGGGAPGTVLYDASDFVPPVNSQSGVDVTLPNFAFADHLVTAGSFPTGIQPGNSAEHLLGSPTDLTFTLSGVGGPDGGDGDGSVAFATGNYCCLGFPQDITTCDGSGVDFVLFSNTGGTGVAELQFKLDGTTVFTSNQSVPGGTAGSGSGGVTVDLPDGITFDAVRIQAVSGTFELDAVAARTAPSPTSDDICFEADTSGVYEIEVTATDGCGNQASDVVYVTVSVNEPPVANAGADQTVFACDFSEICFPVSFTDPDNNMTVTELYSGPGTLSGNQVCFTPASEGTYTFIIRTVDECGLEDRDTVFISVEKNSPPVAANPSTVNQFLCSSQQLCHTFTVTDPDGGTLAWSLLSGPGTISATTGQYCFTPTSSGSYLAKVVVTDSCGAADTTQITYNITINSAPVASDPTTPVSVSQCTPAEICYLFTATDVNGGLLTWTKNGGPGTLTSTGQWCFTPTASGSYTVNVTVTDACGATDVTSLTYNITINEPPSIALGADYSVNLCDPEPVCVDYTVADPQGPGGLVEAMVSGYGSIDTAQNIVCFTPTTDGEYEIIVGVTDPCGETDEDTIVVTVSFGSYAAIDCPTAPIDVYLCQADQICQTLDITPAGATVTTSYGTYSGGELCFEADTAGIYVITVTAESSCGNDECVLTFNVSIGEQPQITCPPAQERFICNAGNVCIPVGVVGAGAAVTVSPIGSYSAGNLCFPADTSGHYEISMSATTDCGTANCTVVVDVTIDSEPIANDPLTPVDTFVCAPGQICYQFEATDVDGGALTWTRLSGNGTVTSDGLWCFDVTSTGVRTVTVTVADACGKKDTTALTYNVTLNSAPIVAFAKSVQITFLCAPEEICINYSVSDADDNILLEELTSGTGSIDTAANKICFTPTLAGLYQFDVKVTDACGAIATASYQVNVAFNSPPIVDAGADQTIFQCTKQQICWPVSATDPDDNLATVELVNSPGTYDGTNICFTPTGTLNYEFVLKATDDCGAVSYDTVVIYYTLNTAPVANAGPDQTLFLCTPTQICWPASCSDIDGNLTSGTLISGPGFYNGSSICFTPTASGSYTFVLQATDACGATHQDQVTISVTINSDPVCVVPNDTSIFQCTPTQVCLPAYGTDADNNLVNCQIISGPGTLVGGSWCYTPASSQTVTVTMLCEDACGATCESQFTVDFGINKTPTIAFGPDQTVEQCSSAELCLPYTASDPNDPRVRTISLVSGPGTLDLLNSQVCFTPTVSGSYTFIVRIEDECGLFDQDTINAVVTVNNPPVANAGADQTLFMCEPAELCWPASCTDVDGNLLDCTFSGPGLYDGARICFTPTGSGTYQFSLSAEDACGETSTDIVNITVTINSTPVVDLGTDQTVSLCQPQQICIPYTVTDANGPSKIREAMVSGYGAIDTSANTICFTPTSTGDYEFIVRATDSCGAFDEDTVMFGVTVGQAASIECPTSPFDVFLCQPDQICQMLDITPSSAAVTVSYGTYTGGELCFEADTAGTYVIDVSAETSCGTDNCQLVFNVTIGDAPQISCPPPSSKFICQTGSVCIPVGVVGGGAVVTVSPIGSYSGGNLCFPADTSGHYELQMVATTDCGSDTCTVVVDVTIDSKPVAVDPSSPVDTFLCDPAQICYQFEAGDADADGLTWTRLTGVGSITAEGLWCFTPTVTGNYSVTVVVADACGKKDTTTLTYNVEVNNPPTVAFAKTPPATFLCGPEEVCAMYTVADPNDNIELEELISGAGAIDTALNKLCFTPDTAGTYLFVIRVTDSCGASATATYSLTIRFNAPPVANAGADQSIYQCTPQAICWSAGCTDPDDNVDSCYVLGGVGSFNSSQICFTPDTAGVYTFILRSVDDCGASDQDTVVVTVDLNAPPICQLPNDTTFRQCVSSPVSLGVTATDPDGNFDHCELLRGPGSIANGLWSYTPTKDQTVKVVVMCEDECGATCTDSFSVTFQINAPPVVDLGADTSVFLCGSSTICLDVHATDEDGNLMTVEEISPYGTFDAQTFEYCLNALFGADRTYNVVMKATDSCGAYDYDTVKVFVDFNSPPVVELPPDFVAYLDQVGELCFDATITDNEDNITSVAVSPIGSYNEATGQVCFDVDTTGQYCIAVTAVDACGQQTTQNVCIEVQVDECIHVQIEKVLNVLQGHMTSADIYLNGSGKQLGGFSFLIAYDGSALTPINVVPGQLLEACGWEYFTYRYGADGNCTDGCPSGLLKIVGIAETNNGAYHPGCFFDGLVGSLATMTFLTSNDRRLECQWLPINFFWLECTDNTFSSRAGDTMWVSRSVYDSDLNSRTDFSYGFPGYFGAPDLCLEGGGVGKPQPIRCVDYTNGGIKIICADSIDARGDINLNGLAYEVSDAVMFTNYFIHGLNAFGSGMSIEGSIAASDVNVDGMPLTVADLVFLIRVIVGDCEPIAKPLPNKQFKTEFTVSNHTLKIVETDADIGAIYLVLEGDAHPSLDENVKDMELQYNFDGENTRVLIYNHNASAVIDKGPILKLNDARRVKSIEVASSDGYVMSARLNNLPEEYSLSQNYPNPFNPVTNIEFALPVAGEWKLVIYNILGQVVESWNDESDAGFYKVEWDAGRYASGVYFYRLTAGEFSATRKMVLLK